MQAVTDFGNRNHLPRYLQEQMIAHTRLKFKTESLQQQETLETLPKAIRASVAQQLFLSTMEKVYLFQGTSSNLLTQLVSPGFFPQSWFRPVRESHLLGLGLKCFMHLLK